MKADDFNWPPASGPSGGGGAAPNASAKQAAADRAAARRAKLPSQQAAAAQQRQNLFGNTYSQNYGQGNKAAPIPDLSDPDNASVEELQAQTNKHQQAIDESQARMLRMAADATQTGAATLEQLHHQGEQLKHIQKEQGKIDNNLQTSDKILKGMESWGGAFKNWVTGKGDKGGKGAKGGASAEAGSSSANPPPGAGAGGAGGGGGNPFGAGSGKQPAGANPFATQQQKMDAAANSGEDDAMDRLAGLVEGMHGMAQSMQAEIAAQSDELDKTIANADRHKDKLTNVTARTKKVGGKGLFG